MNDKTALIFGDQQLSYRQLNQKANQVAWSFHQEGVGPGERVALLLPNGLEMAELYFGISKAGVVGVPLNLRWAPPEIAYAMRDADISLVIADPDFEPILSQIPFEKARVFYTGPDGSWTRMVSGAPVKEPDFVTVRETDPWVLVYTSGTTGRPKGAIRTHMSNIMIALALVSELGISSDQIGFAILPMFHVNSMWFVTLSVAIGATCAIYPHRTFHPHHVIEQINFHHVNYGMFVPSMLTFLADAVESGKVRADGLEVIMTASAPLDSTLRDRIIRGFPKARLYDIYGSTEYGAATIVRHSLDGPLGSVGYATIGQDIEILDDNRQPVPPGTVGEVFVRGPSLMTEYWKNAEANQRSFTADGFLTVGDMGYQREDGLLFLVDRKQDMIIVAGENVYPSEVEEVLLRYPGVALAAVFGVPDQRRGERVIAVVTQREGGTLDLEQLEELCRQNLAHYKRPTRIIVAPELPIGPSGKVVRRLAKDAWLAQS
ncbi:MAG: acyl--CoA ligase [Firmicutes bacterium]|nr:acyl--CoA ligase [Bacillota bacterium]